MAKKYLNPKRTEEVQVATFQNPFTRVVRGLPDKVYLKKENRFVSV